MGRADGQDFAFLQGAQQLGLKCDRQFGDFVEEQRAAVRRQEQPFGRIGRAGEAALAMAKQHRFHHGFRQRGAVDGDEIARRAARLGVEEARHAFLAGAGVALNENGGFAARDPTGKRHEARAGAVADRRNSRGTSQFGDQGKGEAHIFQPEGDTGGQAVGGGDQRRRAVDKRDQYIAVRRVTDFGRQQHAAAIAFARCGGIDDPDSEQGIFQPVLQPWNERTDASAHIER